VEGTAGSTGPAARERTGPRPFPRESRRGIVKTIPPLGGLEGGEAAWALPEHDAARFAREGAARASTRTLDGALAACIVPPRPKSRRSVSASGASERFP